MVYGHRGGVMGAIATMGIVIGADFELASGATGDPPQFLGAMLVGPLAAWIIMKIDENLQDRVPVGFEMLYNNFSGRNPGLRPGDPRQVDHRSDHGRYRQLLRKPG